MTTVPERLDPARLDPDRLDPDRLASPAPAVPTAPAIPAASDPAASDPAPAARRPDRWRRRLSSAAYFVTTLAATGLLFLAVVAMVIPRLYDGLSLTVLSGSMEPSLSAGDIVVTRGFEPTNATGLAIGDVITFLPWPDDPTLVTHRIVGKTIEPDGTISFTTQGDNNDSTDPWGVVKPHQIRGTVMYSIPKLGYVKSWVGDATATIVLVTAIALLVYGGASLALSWRRRWAKAAAQAARAANNTSANPDDPGPASRPAARAASHSPADDGPALAAQPSDQIASHSPADPDGPAPAAQSPADRRASTDTQSPADSRPSADARAARAANVGPPAARADAPARRAKA
ncbi:MAG: signal peptidase I [Propionibacteriaceae bacterium]|jgi:signal peptidase|nr:signal peptidase I [Propionibacteriaceae bacterium]